MRVDEGQQEMVPDTAPQGAATACIADDLILVAKNGRRFCVGVQIAERSSPYFFALTRNGMIETGKPWRTSFLVHFTRALTRLNFIPSCR
jgi:hypothetical protein